jgi:hypothetical protein
MHPGEPGRFDVNDLLVFVAAALVLFAVLFALARIAADRSVHRGTKSLRRTS